MSRKRKPEKTDRGFPYCAAPSAEPFEGQPESCFDLVNQYGTYEIQPTADTENVFPLIAHGLPESQKDMAITKDDVERMRRRARDEQQT